MRRFPFRALPLTAAVVSIALCGVALARPLDAPASAESDAPRVVEVVRYATRGEYTVEQRLWIDLDRAPDAEAAADGAMGVAQGEATVTAQYKIGKHKWAPGSLPLQVSYNSAGAGSNPPAIEAIQHAVESDFLSAARP